MDHRHRVSHGVEGVSQPEESRRYGQPRRSPRADRRSHERHGNSGLAATWHEQPADRTATDPGTRLSHGPFPGGDRRDHGLPGGYRKGAHVSRAREIAPLPAYFKRRGDRKPGEDRMSNNRGAGESDHEEIAGLIPWYV